MFLFLALVYHRALLQQERIILRMVSSVFDPLGLFAVVIFPARILLQDIWRTNVEWDDPIEESHRFRFNSWVSSLAHLSTLAIPRFYFTRVYDGSGTQLQVFANAS